MRFYVLLEGTGFTSRSEEFGCVIDGQPAKFGFYATRVVDAPNAQRAAIAQVYQDERIRASSADGSGMIVPDEVHRVGWFYKRLRPPRGFTFVVGETQSDQS